MTDPEPTDPTTMPAQPPADPQAEIDLAWTQVRSGDSAEARITIAALTDRFPADGATAATVAELYGALGDQEAARFALDRATALAGDDSTALYRIAGILADQGDPEAALAVYDRILAWQPREVYMARADLRVALGDSTGAVADLDAALAAPPTEGGLTGAHATARILVARARLRQTQRDWAAARVDAEAALALEPDTATTVAAWAVLGRIAQETSDLPAARAAHEQVLARDPAQLPAWVGLVSVHTAARDWETALQTVRRGQEHFPAELSLALSAALIRGEQGDLDGALDEWTRLIAIAPDNATALAMRGALALQLNRPRAADADITAALRLEPNNIVALQAHISLGLRAGNTRAVLADLQRILTVEPHDTDMRLLRAGIHLEGGDVLAAVSDYNRVLEIAPDNAAAFSGIGNAQMIAGRPDAALVSYEAALRGAPGNGAALFNLAGAQAAAGRCPQAVELLRRAVAADPRFASAAQESPYLAPCRTHPHFAAALRPTQPPAHKGKKHKK